MARPREFDQEAVLAAATECFRTHGYEATSVRRLADKMGITGASLYNAFGDKRALYKRVLEEHVASGNGDCIGRFENRLPPREAIVRYFGDVIAKALSDKERRGCMLVNAALEVLPDDAEFQQVVGSGFVQNEEFFLRCVKAGQKDGSIATTHAANDLARLLLGVLLGIHVLARTRPERALLEGLVRPVFALLEK